MQGDEQQRMADLSPESDESVDEARRRFLTLASVAAGGVGLAAASMPFLLSMLPSARAEAAAEPVRVRIDDLKPGEQRTVIWRGKPIWIIRRTDAMLQGLQKDLQRLSDPSSRIEQQPLYAQNATRSRKPEWLVLVAICTHLGCAPTYRPDPKSIDAAWPGGFFCACHGSKFDLAGRVYKGVPAPINLEVPPYYFANDNEIVIGAEYPTPTKQG